MNYHKKIKLLNEAYSMIKNGLDVLWLNTEQTSDMKTFLWRLNKDLKDINREVLKQLKKEHLDKEFKKITRQL